MALSIVVPVRDVALQRLTAIMRRNLSVIGSVASEYLIADFGSVKYRYEDLEGLDKRIRVVRTEAERWSYSQASNFGITAAGNDIICRIDADVIISSALAGQLPDIAGSVSSASAIVLVQCRDLPRKTNIKTATDARLFSLSRLRPTWGQGGIQCFHRASWARIGGYEERFFGWGNDDNDFVDRLRRTAHTVRWVADPQACIYHVWHETYIDSRQRQIARHHNNLISRTDRSAVRPMGDMARQAAARYTASSAAPVFSIAIPVSRRRNAARHLAECLQSLENQTFRDFEVIICENGASVGAAQMASGFSFPVRLFTEKTKSIPIARNRLAREARGRFTCIVDSDDLQFPTRLEDHYAVHQKDAAAHGSHGGWIDFDEGSGRLEYNHGKNRTLASLLYAAGKVTAHPASCVLTDLIRQMPYDETMRLGSDLDLAIRIAAAKAKIAHTGSFVVYRRFHARNVTFTGASEQEESGATSKQQMRATLPSGVVQRLQEEGGGEEDVFCRRLPDEIELILSLPDYVGRWIVELPVRELACPDRPRLKKVQLLLAREGYAAVSASRGKNTEICYRSKTLRGVRELRRQIEKLWNAGIFGFRVRSTFETEIEFLNTDEPLRAVRVEPGARRIGINSIKHYPDAHRISDYIEREIGLGSDIVCTRNEYEAGGEYMVLIEEQRDIVDLRSTYYRLRNEFPDNEVQFIANEGALCALM